MLEPLPGYNPVGVSIEAYIDVVYWVMIGLAGFLAVLKIVMGAILITAAGGSEANQSKGREMISMALWGLLLALMAVLILNSINPQLIRGTF